MEDITEMSTQFNKQTKRLVELKEKQMTQEEGMKYTKLVMNTCLYCTK